LKKAEGERDTGFTTDAVSLEFHGFYCVRPEVGIGVILAGEKNINLHLRALPNFICVKEGVKVGLGFHHHGLPLSLFKFFLLACLSLSVSVV